MRVIFNEEMNQLLDTFNEMGTRVNEAIYQSIQSFIKHDKQTAKQIIEQDTEINDLEKAIDMMCNEIIALQQPNTSDLRRIITVLKASTDLERMADHAVSIAHSTIRIKGNKRSHRVEKMISDMGEIIKWMTYEIIQALPDFNMEHALDVASRDDEIDELNIEVKRVAIDRMENDSEVVWGATDYVLVANYIERIGDYITNIAEGIVYLETGDIKELN